MPKLVTGSKERTPGNFGHGTLMTSRGEDLPVETLWISLLSGLLGAIIAAILTGWLNRRERNLASKRDVLRRLLGYRFRLTVDADTRQIDEPFVALNEAVVVFSDCPDVIRSLERMLNEIDQGNRFLDNLITLIKAMAKACQIPATQLNDSYFQRPFTPPSRKP